MPWSVCASAKLAVDYPLLIYLFIGMRHKSSLLITYLLLNITITIVYSEKSKKQKESLTRAHALFLPIRKVTNQKHSLAVNHLERADLLRSGWLTNMRRAGPGFSRWLGLMVFNSVWRKLKTGRIVCKLLFNLHFTAVLGHIFKDGVMW